MSDEIKVIRWCSYEEAKKLVQSFGGLGGFFDNGMRWADYISTFDDSVHKYANALRESIITNKIKECGPWHQESDCGSPVFSDGTVATFSYRAWGDLLAAVWSSEENRDSNYMEFYC